MKKEKGVSRLCISSIVSKEFKKVFLSTLFYLGCVATTFGQHVDDGKVVAILQYGAQDVAIILNQDNNLHYKSTLYNAGELTATQHVDLSYPADPNQLPKVITSTLTTNVHANLMSIPGGDGSPDPNLIYALPEQENSILFFNSPQHLYDVCDMMDAYLDASGEDGMDEDDKLDIIQEQYPGFVSHRDRYFETFFPDNGTFTYDDVIEVLDREFVNYNVLQTFLNEERMIGLGDKIYYYHARDFIVEFDKNDLVALNYFSGISEDFYNSIDVDLTDRPDFIEFIIRGNVYLISTNHGFLTSSKGAIVDPNTGWAYQTFIDANAYEDNFCDALKKSIAVGVAEIENFNTNNTNYSIYNLSGKSAVLTIDWDDGTVQVIQNYTGGEVIHYYTTAGTFEVQTSITFLDRFGDFQTIDDGTNANSLGAIDIIFITDPECSEADDEETYAAVQGPWMLYGKVWVMHNILGTHVGSLSRALKQNNGGNYEKSKAKIHTAIDGNFRNDDCNIVENEQGDKTRNNDKEVSKSKSKVFQKHMKLGTFDIKSNHFLDKDGYYITFNIFITC